MLLVGIHRFIWIQIISVGNNYLKTREKMMIKDIEEIEKEGSGSRSVSVKSGLVMLLVFSFIAAGESAIDYLFTVLKGGGSWIF